MESRISIELDFSNGNVPVIQILQQNSDDVRDKILKNFLEQFGGGSSWLKIRWAEFNPMGESINKIDITAIKPDELKVEAETMIEQYRLNEEWLNNHVDKLPKQSAV